MKCPECDQKMVFNRDIKDYYCETCEMSLEEIELGEQKSPLEMKQKSIRTEKKGKRVKKPLGKKIKKGSKIDRDEETSEEEQAEQDKQEKSETSAVPIQPPEIGTIKGILFILIGSLIYVITIFLPAICQILSIIGIFLLIFGFFLMYRDKHNYSEMHVQFLKLAAIVFVIWIAVYIALNIYLFQTMVYIENELTDLKSKDLIPNNIIIKIFEDVKYVAVLSFVVIILLAIFRYLAIRNLIQDRLKKVLEVSVLLLIVGGILSLYVNIEYSNFIVDNIDNTTKEEFENLDLNLTKEEDQNFNLLSSGVRFLNIMAEVIMILCFYWTYTYQKSKPRNY
jgi:hypothetical protein